MNEISCVFINGIGLVTISEISTFPLGFTLYIYKPENYKPVGEDLTVFADFDYDNMPDIDVIAKALDDRKWEEF